MKFSLGLQADRPQRLSVLALAAAACTLAALPARADELSDLKAQMQVMAQRLADLEAKQKAMAAQPAPAPAPAATPAAQAPSLALQTDVSGNPLHPGSTALTLFDNGNTSLSMYGLVEATVSHANNQAAGGATVTGFQVAYFSGNKIGFDMQHGIGSVGTGIGMPDLKIISKLEGEFELPSGEMDTPGVLFNRDAWLGFYSKSLGKITLGRQNTLTRDFNANWGDPFTSPYVSTAEGGYTNDNNFKQLIFYSAGPEGTRYNSAVEWKKDFDGHLIAGLAYAFGQGGAGSCGGCLVNAGATPGNNSNGSGEAAALAYNHLRAGALEFNLNGNYDRGVSNNLIDQSYMVGGNVLAGPWRLNAGYIRYTGEQGLHNSAGTRTDNAWTTSLQYKPALVEYDIGYQVMKGNHAGLSGGGTVLNPFFGDASGVTTTVNGKKTSIYGAIRFDIDKHTDIYLAADWFKVDGGWVVGDQLGNGLNYGVGNPYSSEMEVATGVRYKF